MLLGDVLVVVASVIALGVSTWALFVGCAFMFDRRTVRAKNAIKASAARSFWLGLLTAIVITTIGLQAIALPLPIAKVIGLLILTGLSALVGIGGGGLTRMIAERIQGEDHSVTRLPALVRASLYVVLIAAMPVLGTLIVSPIVISLCAGAGVQALFSRADETVPSEA